MPPPPYWRSETHGEPRDEPVLFESRYMRRKLEYLLRSSAKHPNGCRGQPGLGSARVVKVERLENATLWRRYEAARVELRQQQSRIGWELQQHESCRPVRCDVDDDECYLFHGTLNGSLQRILEDGFDVDCAEGRRGRYGEGLYFSDDSCKAHQYADNGELPCGGKVYCMLYCRVALGHTMRFNATQMAARRKFLVGMKRPAPGDPVFEHNVRASGGKAKVRQAWHSVAVLGASDQVQGRMQDRMLGPQGRGAPPQVHREFVLFEDEQVYPEYVVYYRLDSEDEEGTLRQQSRAKADEKHGACLDYLISRSSEYLLSRTPSRALHERRCKGELQQLDGGAHDGADGGGDHDNDSDASSDGSSSSSSSDSFDLLRKVLDDDFGILDSEDCHEEGLPNVGVQASLMIALRRQRFAQCLLLVKAKRLEEVRQSEQRIVDFSPNIARPLEQ